MVRDAPGLIDLATLARLKGLPAETLRRFGLSDRGDGGVRIEYLAPDGGPVRSRIRLACKGPDGSRWEDGEDPFGAYWRPLVNDLGRERGVLLLCEGESSCWTAWYAGVGAVGIPGADEVAALRLDHVAASPALCLVIEPEDPETYPRGRQRYLDDLRDRLDGIGYAGFVAPLYLDAVALDLNALYRADPSAFPQRLEVLIARSLNARTGSEVRR